MYGMCTICWLHRDRNVNVKQRGVIIDQNHIIYLKVSTISEIDLIELDRVVSKKKGVQSINQK